MSTAAPHAASSPRWTDLPSDQLRDISSRLHDAGDYVRFHAVCKPWRGSLPPAPRRPALQPWLLAPRAAAATVAGHRIPRCVFSGSKATRRGRPWVTRAEDGVTGWIVVTSRSTEPSSCLVDPLTGSLAATLPRFPCDVAPWIARAAGTVSGDGTTTLHGFGRGRNASTLSVALARPGDAAWTVVEEMMEVFLHRNRRDGFSVAYHARTIVMCHGCSWSWIAMTSSSSTPLDEAAAAVGERRWRHMVRVPGKVVQSTHLVECRGELLWAFVQVDTWYYSHIWSYGADGGLAESLSVTVYALWAETMQWERRDGRSMLPGRVLFLGRRPGSFALDAARIGMAGSGGCAYFSTMMTRPDQGILSRSSAIQRSFLFKYRFEDDTAELVEELPREWKSETCMWITPQPAIASSYSSH